MALKKIDKAIVKTLCYADVFNYPLNIFEVWKWLIKIKSQKSKVKNTIKKLTVIKNKKEYYFLKGRENIIAIRQQREKWAKEKLKIAKRIASLFKIIPWVKLVGVTGALSMQNTREDDDIDLFLITSKNLLWTTRFLSTIIIELTGKRRHPADVIANNKICLNMFIDEDHLPLPSSQRDLFSAHEVLQMKPIWEKNNIYKKFILENNWTEKYLPNAYRELTLTNKPEDTLGEVARRIPPRWRNQQSVLEIFLKKFQLWYMQTRRTKEVIKKGIIRFHPNDARKWILENYQKRVNNLL